VGAKTEGKSKSKELRKRERVWKKREEGRLTPP